jgi:hypothetical protein
LDKALKQDPLLDMHNVAVQFHVFPRQIPILTIGKKKDLFQIRGIKNNEIELWFFLALHRHIPLPYKSFTSTE